jgi:hypothetical protein
MGEFFLYARSETTGYGSGYYAARQLYGIFRRTKSYEGGMRDEVFPHFFHLDFSDYYECNHLKG